MAHDAPYYLAQQILALIQANALLAAQVETLQDTVLALQRQVDAADAKGKAD